MPQRLWTTLLFANGTQTLAPIFQTNPNVKTFLPEKKGKSLPRVQYRLPPPASDEGRGGAVEPLRKYNVFIVWK
jgi:hypothetical protein